MRGLFSFSGDPITFGHVDVIRRAASICDELIVGIGVNSEKNYLFSLNDRLSMARRAVSDIKNVQVTFFDGLAFDFARTQGIQAVFKSFRTFSDFEYELKIHRLSESQNRGIETIQLFPSSEFELISSSGTKALVKENGFVHEMVPLFVKQALEAKILNQFIVGISGRSGSGKSFAAKHFMQSGQEKNISVHNIDFDVLGHEILSSFEYPLFKNIREEIARAFGKNILEKDGRVNRTKLGKVVFYDKEKLNCLNEIMHPVMFTLLRRELNGKEGIVFFDAALIPDLKWNFVCNNSIVLIDCDSKAEKHQLVNGRNLPSDYAAAMICAQLPFKEKLEIIEKEIQASGNGIIWQVDNSSPTAELQMNEVFNEIVSLARKEGVNF